MEADEGKEEEKKEVEETAIEKNKAGHTVTLVGCGWAGAVLEKVTGSSGQELYTQKAKKTPKK